MKRLPLVLLLLCLAGLWGPAGAAAQAKAPEEAPPHPLRSPGLHPLPPPPEVSPGGPGARSGELDCSGCHQGQHQGVLRMYLGLGGKGTPMIPSHMLQVRVECVACHIVPKESEATARIVGQTFRPSEQACLNCHGEKYRGMLQQWTDTLGRMREIIAPKLAAARAALPPADGKDRAQAQARQLVADAEYNVRFVTLGKGVHNVFYAADLLKLSNTWLDQALAELKKPAPRRTTPWSAGGTAPSSATASRG